MAPSTQLQSYLVLPSPSSIQPYTVLPRPNVVDAWLRYNHNDAWTNPLIPGYLFLTDTASDQVLCTIQLSRVLLLTDDTFEDWYLYNLVMYTETPESSGVNPSYLSSPLVTLGRYEGFTSDIDAPEWTRMEVNQPLQFRQPRGAMAEVFMKIAFWAENADIVSMVIQPERTPLIALAHLTQPGLPKVMMEWAIANSLGTPAHSQIQMPITPEHTPPRTRVIPQTPRGRKSGDTARMSLADETPTRRVTRSMAACSLVAA